MATTLFAGLALAAPASAAPANDDIANAQILGPALPASVASTTVEASGEAGETIYSVGNPATESVWFRWTPTANTAAVVDLCSANFSGGPSSPAMGVYTGAGNTFASLTEVAATAGECKLRFSADMGTTYKIQIDFLHAQGTFNLTLRQFQPPANDNFAAAQSLGEALPTSVAGVTIDSSGESGEPAFLGNVNSARSVWFSWKAPSSGQVQVSGCPFTTLPGFASNKALAAYTGTSLSALTSVAQTNSCTLEFNATAGTTYRIAFSGTIRGEGTFTLAIRSAAPPANDNLADADALGPALPLSVQGDNTFATAEAGEDALLISGQPGSAHSVWHQWTPVVSELVVINVCDAVGYPRLGVFTGGPTIASLVVATDPQDEEPYCTVPLSAVAGTTYSIAVTSDDTDGNTGPFNLRIRRLERPANDDFAAAIGVGPELPISVDGDNFDATVEAGEVAPATNVEPLSTVWYRWASNFSGPVDVSTCSPATPAFASVHVGPTFAAMTTLAPTAGELPRACAPLGEHGARESFVAAAGTTYWIQVSSFVKDVEGPFRLTITDPNAQPPASKVTLPGALVRKNPIKQCRQRFKGKSRKANKKRARCIRKAKRKAAIAKCHKIDNRSKRKQCVKRARKRHYR